VIVYPAIDLRQGRCVRLVQGDPRAETVFSDDPAATAQRWAEQGAGWLHVVNLDGAFGDATAGANLAALRAVLAAVSTPVQLGGGLRALPDIEAALALGVQRAIIGTAALEQPTLIHEAVRQFGANAIAVAIDARDGRVATRGWQTLSDVAALDLALQVRDAGVERIIYTDISRDGMLSGVNATACAQLAQATGLKVIASGGVATLADVERVKAVEEAGVDGIIIGRALYTGQIDLRVALSRARRA
jgi:phosphoribosylformimino-5-aminoimidazole carboxamide ribotide isomerase